MKEFVEQAVQLGRQLGATVNSPLYLIVDCYGRAANRLTVINHLFVHCLNHGGTIVDLAMVKELGHVTRPVGQKAGRCITYHDTDWRQRRLLRKFYAKTRSHLSQVEQTSQHQPIQVFDKVALLRGDRSNRFDLCQLPFEARTAVRVVTGIFFETERNTLHHRSFAERWLHGRPSPVDRPHVQSVYKVGVHIRQGDYRTWNDGRFFYETSDYDRAMRWLNNQCQLKCKFMVCSDQKQYRKSFDPSLDIRISSATAMNDLRELSQCDLILATHSSFANWASFAGAVPLMPMPDALRLSDQDVTLDFNSIPTVETPSLQGDFLVRLRGSDCTVGKAA